MLSVMKIGVQVVVMAPLPQQTARVINGVRVKAHTHTELRCLGKAAAVHCN